MAPVPVLNTVISEINSGLPVLPTALNCVLPFIPIDVNEAEAVTVVGVETVTVAVAVLEHPKDVVPVTVYTLVRVVDDITVAPVVVFRFVDGDQE